MIFSIKVWSELLAADRVKRERGEKHDDNSDVNDVQHNFQQAPPSHNATTPHILSWVNLKTDSRIALPIADEVS
jgi:hypothetical protein